jgi:hypothetical protein
VQPDNEDEAWRSIVENYGDRPDLDPWAAPPPEPEDDLSDPGQDRDPVGEHEDALWQAEQFVPPTPPPLPRVARDRLAAWIGVFGSPTVLLVCLVFGIPMPSLLGYALVAAFVGGFAYLVVQMPRGPRDPFDDGARL